jgi:hypothetical protein
MSRYDFASLSSRDFEELARDLLQAEWNVVLESFRSGKDCGIDLRYMPARGGATIVQCKHYAVSGFSKLTSNLRDVELPKIRRLRPPRYVVVTSVNLTPGNKDEIAAALRPFVKTPQDILGAGDLEGLLSRHPAVERANFKLWLTSTGVMERVLHNAELVHTEFKMDRIRRKLRLFVQSDAFPRAIRLLDDMRTVVISGVPGIGKTTLAEMLLFSHLEQGYEPVVIQGEIAEGRRVFKPGVKQVFYYDDFLGQIFLKDRSEYLGRNQDAALVDFIEMVQQSPSAKFILTTREHILRSALQVSERLAQSVLLQHRCVLELRDYSYGDKARILYNHLYFSDLPQEYRDAVLQDDYFLTVIKHPHFNPRLIEWLSAFVRVRSVKPHSYSNYISRLLQCPDEIWAHAFRNQISNAARDSLLSLYTLGEWLQTVDLEPAFVSLHRHRAAKYHHTIAPGDFRNSLQELDGAFLSYSSGFAMYLNPSIKEFVASVLSSDPETAEDLLMSAVRFKQVVNIWQLSRARPESELQRLLAERPHLLQRNLLRLLYGPSTRWEKQADGTTRGYPIDIEEESRIAALLEIADIQKSPTLCVPAVQACDHLVESWNRQVPNFSGVLLLLSQISENEWSLAHGGRDMYRRLLDGVLQNIRLARATDWVAILPFVQTSPFWTDADKATVRDAFSEYRDEGITDERYDCTTLQEIEGLVDDLTSLQKFGVDFSQAIDRLNQDISEREDGREEPDEGIGISPSATTVHRRETTDEEIRDMFSILSEP